MLAISYERSLHSKARAAGWIAGLTNSSTLAGSVNAHKFMFLYVELGAVPRNSARLHFHSKTFASVGELHKIHDGEQLEEALQAVESLDQQQIPIPKDIIYCILQGCTKRKDLAGARRLRSLMVKRGLARISIFGDYLIRLFTFCGCLSEADEIFCMVSKPSVYTWNAIISAHVNLDNFKRAHELYHAMQQTGNKPSKVTFLLMLKACATAEGLEQGRLIHNHITRCGLDADRIIGNSVVDMYAKCGNLEQAHEVFDELQSRDVVSYGALIAGYAQHGPGHSALGLFERMRKEGVKPNKVIFLCIMKACGKARALAQGRQIHEHISKSGLLSDVVVGSALVDMYIKCGSLLKAFEVFDRLPNRNVVSWGAMIAGFVQHGDSHAALLFFENMQQEGIKPDRAIFLGILRACASIGSTGQGRLIHHQIIESALEIDVSVGNTVVDMYSKCGSTDESRNVFARLLIRDAVSWGALITGYVLNGHYSLAWQCLKDMQLVGLKPSEIVFTSMLAGCSNAGLVKEGYEYFNSMVVDFGITPSVEHYNCMVDLLGRTGRLDEARKLLQSMPLEPNIVAWRSLLAGCKTYGNTELGKQCFDEVVRLNPTGASSFVLMSNIYGEAHMWDNVLNIQEYRKGKASLKKPGRAFIEIANNIHEFTVGEKSHKQTDRIDVKVKSLGKLIKEDGYVPELNVMYSLNEHREHALPGQNEEETIKYNVVCSA